MTMLAYARDDGGRADAGFKGDTGDCVTRSIAIATETPYREVYEDLRVRMIAVAERSLARGKKLPRSPRLGVTTPVFRSYLDDVGWRWTPTMEIGSGCTVHLDADELPDVDRMIVRLSKHLTAVVDGVIRDTDDPRRLAVVVRGGDAVRRETRCVYGYWVGA